MRVWRLKFKGNYPEHIVDIMGNNLEDVVKFADKHFRKRSIRINTKTELVDAMLISDNALSEVDVKD